MNRVRRDLTNSSALFDDEILVSRCFQLNQQRNFAACRNDR